jgi:hypothetical protein
MKMLSVDFYPVSLMLMLIVTSQVMISQEDSQPSTLTDYHYLRFKSQYEKGLGLQDMYKLGDPPSNIDQVFFKTELPAWFFHLPCLTDSMVYAIGISDPGMSTDSAHQLAVLRAKTICAIISNSKITGLCDYYINEKDIKSGEVISSVYHEFNKIVCTLTYNSADFTIEQEVITDHGEAIVLVSLRKREILSGDTTMINCLAEVSGSHVKRNNKHSTTSRIEMMGAEKNNTMNLNNYFYYVVKNNHKQMKILSEFSGNPLAGVRQIMTYKPNNNNSILHDTARISCTLQYGLWHAFCSVLLHKLVLSFQESSAEQSSLSDQHTSIMQNINRILTQKEVAFGIDGLQIQNNNLYLDLDYVTKD